MTETPTITTNTPAATPAANAPQPGRPNVNTLQATPAATPAANAPQPGRKTLQGDAPPIERFMVKRSLARAKAQNVAMAYHVELCDARNGKLVKSSDAQSIERFCLDWISSNIAGVMYSGWIGWDVDRSMLWLYFGHAGERETFAYESKLDAKIYTLANALNAR